jgi:flagellin
MTMLSLHTNTATLSAQNSIGRTQHSLSTSMTRLSTGYRINSAMDDAAGLQIATRLKAQTSGMAVAMRNTQNSTSMLQTAEGALDEVSNILVRMKDLATQAADASSTVPDQKAMQGEYDALGKELYNIMNNTSFGGSKLLKGGTIATTMTFQIGATAEEKMEVDLSSLMTAVEGVGNSDVDVIDGQGLLAVSEAYATGTTAGELGGELFDITAYELDVVEADPTTPATTVATVGAAKANLTISVLSAALDKVGEVRSGLGAAANRLDHVFNNLSNISNNTKAATGRIMDVDFATESSNMTTKQMLMQAGTAMLKQTNSMSSMVMSLLQ